MVRNEVDDSEVIINGAEVIINGAASVGTRSRRGQPQPETNKATSSSSSNNRNFLLQSKNK